MNGSPSYLTTGKAAGNPALNSAAYNRLSRQRLLFATLATLVLAFTPFLAMLLFGEGTANALAYGIHIVLYPLRLFITFIHETGHALAALLTGNVVQSLHIMPNGEGLTWTSQTFLTGWIVNSAGYLGTTLFGATMLHVGHLRRLRNPGRAALYFAAVSLLLITLLWGWHDVFTFGAGMVLSAGLFAMARFLSPAAADFVALFLAVQCSLNALEDIGILLSLTTHGAMQNDAGNMAKNYGLPPTFWALAWAAASLIVLFFSLRSYWRATHTISPVGTAVS